MGDNHLKTAYTKQTFEAVSVNDTLMRKARRSSGTLDDSKVRVIAVCPLRRRFIHCGHGLASR